MSTYEFRDSVEGGSTTKKRVSSCLVSLGVVFLVLAVVGGLAPTVIPEVVKQQIASLVPMKNVHSLLFKHWQDTELGDLGITRKFYFFNLTNPYEVVNNHSKPDFHVVGPYYYREHTYSPLESVKWTPQATIEYTYATDMTFVPELSIDETTGKQLSLNDRHTVVNFPLIDSMWRLDKLMNWFLVNDPSFDIILGLTCDTMYDKMNVRDPETGERLPINDKGIFINRTVEEYIHGYDEPIWEIQHSAAGFYKNSTTNEEYNVPTYYQGVFNSSQPAPSPASPRYGQKCPMWNQSECNTSTSQVSSMYSGEAWTYPSQVDVDGTVKVGDHVTHGSLDQVGSIRSWAGNEKMWWWGEENDGVCQKFEGSNALNFWPGVTKDDHPFVFFDAIFRKIQMKYHSDKKIGKLDTYKFVMDDVERYVSDRNKCYDQSIPGMLNMTRAMWAPLYITNPYFYNTPTDGEWYTAGALNRSAPVAAITLDGVDMETWKEAHTKDNYETYVAVEPHTGASVEALGFLQAVTWMSDLNLTACASGHKQGLLGELLGTKDVWRDGVRYNNSQFPQTMVPFFYMARHAKMPDSLNKKLYDEMILPLHASVYGGYGLLGFSVALCVLCCVLIVKRLTEPSVSADHNKFYEGEGANQQEQDRSPDADVKEGLLNRNSTLKQDDYGSGTV